MPIVELDQVADKSFDYVIIGMFIFLLHLLWTNALLRRRGKLDRRSSGDDSDATDAP